MKNSTILSLAVLLILLACSDYSDQTNQRDPILDQRDPILDQQDPILDQRGLVSANFWHREIDCAHNRINFKKEEYLRSYLDCMYSLSEYWKKRDILIEGYTCVDCYQRMIKIDPDSKALFQSNRIDTLGPYMNFSFENFRQSGEFIHINGEAHLVSPPKFRNKYPRNFYLNNKYLHNKHNYGIATFYHKGKFKRRNPEKQQDPYARRLVTIHWDKPLFDLDIPAKKE